MTKRVLSEQKVSVSSLDVFQKIEVLWELSTIDVVWWEAEIISLQMISEGNVLALARIVYSPRDGYRSSDSDVILYKNFMLKDTLAENKQLCSWRIKKVEEENDESSEKSLAMSQPKKRRTKQNKNTRDNQHGNSAHENVFFSKLRE